MLTSTSIDDATAFSEEHPFQGGFDFDLFMDFIFGGSQPGGVSGYGGGPLDDSLLDILLRLYNKEITLEEAYEQYPDEMQIFEDAAKQYRTQLENNPVDINAEDTTQDEQEELIDLNDYVEAVTEEEIDEEEAEEETTIGESIENTIEEVKEAFPTWEDLWGRVKDILPSNPQEWGDVIRGAIEAAGVDLPSGDVWDILNGGYGVITDIDRMGSITGILDPANQMIFVPGVPVGLPPSSFIIGSVEDVFTQPGQVLTDLKDKVVGVLEGVVNDPVGAAGQILSGTLDVPPELWEVIVGGATLGSDLLDWLGNTFESGDGEVAEQQETTPPASSVEEQEEEEEVAETTVEPRETLQEKTMGLLAGFRGGLTQPEQTTPEAVTGGGLTFGGGSVVENGIQYDQDGDPVFTGGGGDDDPVENNRTDIYSGNDGCLTFGGGSCAGGDTTTLFSETPDPVLDDPTTEEPTLFSGGGGGGGGGGESTGLFKPFTPRLSGDPELLARQQFPITDFLMGLFTGK